MLNQLSPAPGSKPNKVRAGRGIGSGLGKTAGRGHKGQKSRRGGGIKPGFEGGQMPLQRRLPKLGFNSHLSRVTQEVRLSDLSRIEGEIVDIAALKTANIIRGLTKHAKIIATGEMTKAVTVKGLRVSKKAKEMIEAAGGKVEE